MGIGEVGAAFESNITASIDIGLEPSHHNHTRMHLTWSVPIPPIFNSWSWQDKALALHTSLAKIQHVQLHFLQLHVSESLAG